MSWPFDDWNDPYMLQPRPNHRPTEAEVAEFQDRLEQLGLIATHIGVSFDITVNFGRVRKSRKKAAP